MKITINESQFQRIFEAVRPEFDYNELRGKSFAFKKKYCEQMFGANIGRGSSRLVFQIDDQWVLKLAINRKGIAQNEEEYGICTDGYGSELAPQVDETNSDDEDFAWIVSEYVLPAKKEDFKQVLGVDFEDVIDFCRGIFFGDNRNNRGGYMRVPDVHKIYNKYEENEEAIEFFNEIHEYYSNFDGDLRDLLDTRNWGMVMREDGPQMVILDMGASVDIINQYYSRR